MDASATQRYTLLLATTRHQRAAKRLEDLGTGKYKPQVDGPPEQLDAELDRAVEKVERVVGLVDELKAALPHLSEELERILCHVAKVE